MGAAVCVDGRPAGQLNLQVRCFVAMRPTSFNLKSFNLKLAL